MKYYVVDRAELVELVKRSLKQCHFSWRKNRLDLSRVLQLVQKILNNRFKPNPELFLLFTQRFGIGDFKPLSVKSAHLSHLNLMVVAFVVNRGPVGKSQQFKPNVSVPDLLGTC